MIKISHVKNHLLITITFLVTQSVSGQFAYFNELYNTTNSETTGAVELFDNGYFTVGGKKYSPDKRIVARKYSWDGNILDESETYAGSMNLYSGYQSAMKKLSDGSGFVYCANISDSMHVFSRVHRFDNNLDTTWTTDFDLGQLVDCELTAVKEVIDGFLFFGFYGTFYRSILCLKLNFDGIYQWHSVMPYWNSAADTPTDAIVLSDSIFIVSGTTGYWNSNSDYVSNGWLKKISRSGNLYWSHDFGNPDFNDARLSSLSEMPDGNFCYSYSRAVSGDTIQPNRETVCTVFHDNNGYEEVAENSFETYWKNECPKQIVSSDNSRTILGYYNTDEFSVKSYIVKSDAQGNEIWTHEYAYQTCSTCTNSLYDIEYALDGGYICAGYFVDSDADTLIRRTWLLKIDACGEVEYNGCPPVSVFEENLSDAGIYLWPNPARHTIYVNADPGKDIASLRLLNLTGSVVIESHIRQFTGSYSLDASMLPGGYYFAEIEDCTGHRQLFKLIIE